MCRLPNVPAFSCEARSVSEGLVCCNAELGSTSRGFHTPEFLISSKLAYREFRLCASAMASGQVAASLGNLKTDNCRADKCDAHRQSSTNWPAT